MDVVHFVPWVQEYNVYQTSLPFAICRLLSPRTRKGAVDLRRLPRCSCPLVPGVWTRHSIGGFLSGLFHAGMSHNYQKATVTAWHLRGVVWSLRRYRTSFLKEESSAARPMSTGDPGLIRPQFIDTGHHVIGLITELGGFRLALHGIAMVSKCVQSVRHRSDLRKSTGAVSARLSRRARATLQALRQVQPRTEGYPRRNGSPEAGLTFLGRKKWTEMIKHFLSSQFAHCSCFLSWPIDAFCGQS